MSKFSRNFFDGGYDSEWVYKMIFASIPNGAEEKHACTSR
jgi:hypothetical protein